MPFWKSLAIGLMVLLGISYVGFAYVYSQGGGIMIAGMVAGGMQPKVVILLRDANITRGDWSASVDTRAYKTGFLYCQVISTNDGGPLVPKYEFRVDDIPGGDSELPYVSPGNVYSWEISIKGTELRVWFTVRLGYYLHPESAIVSMSLYLRD